MSLFYLWHRRNRQIPIHFVPKILTIADMEYPSYCMFLRFKTLFTHGSRLKVLNE